MKSTGKGDAKPRRNWVVPIRYQVPRRVVISSLSQVDQAESPSMPGLLGELTLRDMVSRFDNVFYSDASENRLERRNKKVEAIMRHLRKHTLRRRGEQVHQEGLLDWTMTASVFELFVARLNVFERIFFTIDVGEHTSSILSNIWSIFIISMIFVSIIVWTLSTLPGAQHVPEGCVGVEAGECQPEPGDAYKQIEAFCIYVFTAEYFVRLFTVHSVRFPLLEDGFLEALLTGVSKEPVALDGKLKVIFKHVFAPVNIIDVLAILPYWIQLAFSSESGGGALMVLRILRLTRLGRVFRLGKFNEALLLFRRVIGQSLPALLLMIFFIAVGCCLFGTLIWFAEGGEWYPEDNEVLLAFDPPITGRGAYLRRIHDIDDTSLAETPFPSIIHAFWYVIVTISTVGYGDSAPTSPVGKLFGSLAILKGIVVLAMPIGVVGANFSNEYHRVMDEKRRQMLSDKMTKASMRCERVQDDAVMSDSSDDSQADPRWGVGLELRRISAHRAKILADAKVMDASWENLLPPALYVPLCKELRAFVAKFLDIGGAAVEPVATPIVSASCLDDLDSLQARVRSAFTCGCSVLQDAAAGLRQSVECRRELADFVEHCWFYATTFCRVDKVEVPLELFAMKAHVSMHPFVQMKSRRPSFARSFGDESRLLGDPPCDEAPACRPAPFAERVRALETSAGHLMPGALPGMLDANGVALDPRDPIAFDAAFLAGVSLRKTAAADTSGPAPSGDVSDAPAPNGIDVDECHSIGELGERVRQDCLQ